MSRKILWGTIASGATPPPPVDPPVDPTAYFLLQADSAGTTFADRKGVHTLTEMVLSAPFTIATDGTLGYPVLNTPSGDNGQIAIGGPGDLSYMLDGSCSWTLDGLFLPVNSNSKWVFGATEDISYGAGMGFMYYTSASDIFYHNKNSVLFSTDLGMGGKNTWHHWALSLDKDTKTFRVFSDGSLVYENTNSGATFSAVDLGQAYLGGRYSGISSTFRGSVGVLRLTKAVRWTTNFTPPMSLPW